MSSVNDPKCTGFVLDELEAAERKSIREALERDPAVLEGIERLREIAALIRESLEDSSPVELTASQRETILANLDKRRRNPWLLVTAAAAVVFLAVGFSLLWMRSVRTPSAPAANEAAKAVPGTSTLSQNAQVDSQRSAQAHPIIMVDLAGKMTREIAPAQAYYGFRLSPDARQLALDCCADSNYREIWLLDLSGGPLRRLTVGGGSGPVWSPDGRLIVFRDPGTSRLYGQSSDGSGPRFALADDAQAALDFSPDGSLILFQKRGGGLWVESATGRVPSAFVQSSFNEQDARFSSDGRWLAYSSNETGRFEIYVRSVADTAERYQISVNGGISPRWTRDGRQLFYLAPGEQLMSVDLTTSPNSLQVSGPRLLFLVASDVAQFEVAADGQGFIVLGTSR
jgi:dipeptidyl aminopeptidase/acylaminoacyl peptidase